VCLVKIAIGSSSALIRLGVFAAVAWLILGVATLGSPLEQLAAQSKDANVGSCALRALRAEAYCPLKGLQCGFGHHELGESDLKIGRLLSLQGRSRA